GGARLRYGLRFHVASGHAIELALKVNDILRPYHVQTAQELISASPPLLERHTDCLVLILRPADAEAHVQTTSRQHIKRSELLGEHYRTIERHNDYAGAEADACGRRRHVGERHDWIENPLKRLWPELARHGRVLVLGLQCIDQALENPERVIAQGFRSQRDADLIFRRGPITRGWQ